MGLLEFHREGHSQMTLKERRCVVTEGSRFKDVNGAFEVPRMSGPRSRGGGPEARPGRLAAERGMQVWTEERMSK